jgi:kynurenine formamidase
MKEVPMVDIVDEYIRRFGRPRRSCDRVEVEATKNERAQQVLAAARLVRDGRVISLSLPLHVSGPQPLEHCADRQLVTAAAGLASGGGFADEAAPKPHAFDEVQHWSDRLVLRAVLVDLAAYRRVISLEPGYAITPVDIERALAAQGASVQPGDALLVRTGHMTARRDDWGDYAGGASPGLSLQTAPWLHAKKVAAIASDTWGVEVCPAEVDDVAPLHRVALMHMGLAFGEMFDLDTIAADCAADGRYEFMFVAAPAPTSGGCGSPIAAVAIK